jgi:hypothetical protein
MEGINQCGAFPRLRRTGRTVLQHFRKQVEDEICFRLIEPPEEVNHAE